MLADGPVTLLHVEDGQFVLEVIRQKDTESGALIKAGNLQKIQENLKHEPAKDIEMEAAIADIENQIMPILNKLPHHRCLVTSESQFGNIAEVAGHNIDRPQQLHIDTVEEVFNRLANVTYGTPASRLDIPETRTFAAVVLFLRELMHHGSFQFIMIR